MLLPLTRWQHLGYFFVHGSAWVNVSTNPTLVISVVQFFCAIIIRNQISNTVFINS